MDAGPEGLSDKGPACLVSATIDTLGTGSFVAEKVKRAQEIDFYVA